MPLSKGTTKSTIQKNTEQLIREGYPPKQAYAIAMREARKNRVMKRKVKVKK